jgi:hypothetical protein
MYLTEIGREVMDRIHLAQDRLCGHGNEPSDIIKGGQFLDYLRDY